MVGKEIFTSKAIWFSFIVFLFLSVSFFWGIQTLSRSDKNNEKRLQQYAEEAIPVGEARAKKECQQENLSDDVCNTITGEVGGLDNECGKYACWNIYVRSSDKKTFRASVTVSRQNRQYVVTHYVRDTGVYEN